MINLIRLLLKELLGSRVKFKCCSQNSRREKGSSKFKGELYLPVDAIGRDIGRSRLRNLEEKLIEKAQEPGQRDSVYQVGRWLRPCFQTGVGHGEEVGV
jgi:hypothetical protein